MRSAVELGQNVIVVLDDVAFVSRLGSSLRFLFRGNIHPMDVESESEDMAIERYNLIRNQLGFKAVRDVEGSEGQ